MVRNAITSRRLRRETRPGLIWRAWCVAMVIVLSGLPTKPAVAQDQDYWTYSARPGDTIWDIAQKHLIDFQLWDELRDLNNIQNPRRMPPGTRINIPLAWLKVDAANAAIETVTGTAQIIRGADQSTAAAEVGNMLNVGDKLTTGDNANVAVRFEDQSLITIEPNSIMHFDRLTLFGDRLMVDTSLRLEEGASNARVGRTTGPASRFEIFTRQAISAVRGTEFRTATSSAEKQMQSEVSEGQVSLAAAGEQVELNAGFGTLTREGEPPETPRALLDPPAEITIIQALEDAPLRLRVAPVDQAVAYHAQLARDVEFVNIIGSARGSDTELTGPRLSAGTYQLRARGVDADRLEGLNQTINVAVSAWPDPPNFIKTELEGRKVTLEWSGGLTSEASGGTALQIARDADFTDLIADEIINGSTFSKIMPEPGQYHARLASVSAAGDQDEFGPATTFDADIIRRWYHYLIPVLIGAAILL